MEKQINQHQFALLIEMMKTLIDKGLVNKAEADKTAERIAVENELPPIYLW